MKLPVLRFPEYKFRIISGSEHGQSLKIFDIIRKKYIVLTPEEWVRQHLIHFLVNERKFPQSLLSVEKKLMVNGLLGTDLVVYSPDLKPLLIAECKSPGVEITQDVFDQAARYNMTLGVRFLIVSNGLETHCCIIDHHNKSYSFITEIPEFRELIS